MTGRADRYLSRFTRCRSRLRLSGACLAVTMHCLARMRNGVAHAKKGIEDRLHCSARPLSLVARVSWSTAVALPLKTTAWKVSGSRLSTSDPDETSRVLAAMQDPTARSKKTLASDVRPSATSTSTKGTSLLMSGQMQRRRARPRGTRQREARARGPGSQPRIAKMAATYVNRMLHSTRGRGTWACARLRKKPRAIPITAASEMRRWGLTSSSLARPSAVM
mmetsp:Transcript_24359/g.61812  ORF Transcript_24359/g.61812 Transcript_24359/m.61812 type:complete len:221 (+) Transcript_24359:544-1206(+)